MKSFNRKQNLIVLLILTGIASFVCKEKKEGLKLDLKLLTESTWGPEIRNNPGWYLTFRPNGVYKEEFTGEGCGGYEGQFVLSGDKLTLSPEKTPSCTPEDEPLVKRSCVLETNNTSLWASFRLNCGKDHYWIQNIPASAGRPVLIDTTSSITTSPRSATINTDTKVRKTPGTIDYFSKCMRYIAGNDFGGKEQNFISKGEPVTVLARTKEIESFENSQNYWYYIQMARNIICLDEDGQSVSNGWVFGDFIKFK